MRKILLLMSAVVIFASCNLDKMVSSREEISNISIVQFSGSQNVKSLEEFDLCRNYHRNDTLFLELLFSKKVMAYPYSELKEEYLDSVKNYKVSMMVKGWKKKEYIPAVIVLSSAIVPVFKYLTKEDGRMFRLKSILKGSEESDGEDIPYAFAYLPLYLWGFANAGNGLLYDNRFFFPESSLEATITTEPLAGGKFSVVADYNGKLQLCQMKYDMEEDMIALRLEDGKTYRYPAALVFPGFREKVDAEMVSACITPTNNWFPVGIYESDYRTGYKPTRLNIESDYLIGGLWKTIKMKDARNYLFSKGMAETMINYDKLFFTKEEMDNRPPKENLKLTEGYIYSGFVDDFGQIRMEIPNYGGRIDGAFYFEAEQKRYELSGTTSIDEEHYELNEDNITLTAYRNDERAGTFKGKWIPGKSFSGVWRPEGSSKRYSFNLTVN